MRADPGRVSEVAALTDDPDWLVSLRGIDLLEKLAHERPEWIEPHKRIFIGRLADSDRWEVRLQVVRALPLFEWLPADRRRATAILLRDVAHPQTFVKAWALDSLAAFAVRNRRLRPTVLAHLRAFERSGKKALQARARRIRRGLRK